MHTIITHSQFEFDILVEAGMDYTQEPYHTVYTEGEDDIVMFQVSKDIADRYTTNSIAIIKELESESN